MFRFYVSRRIEIATSDTTTDDFKCLDCGRRFRTVSSLANHSFKVHTKKPDNLPTNDDFSLHFTTVCAICNQETNINDADHLHPENETSEILIFRCRLCGDDFRKMQDAKRHRKLRHVSKNKVNVVRWPRRCLFCPTMLNNVRNKVQHENEKHASLKRYKCDVCEKSFLRRGNFQVHRDAHSTTKSFICQFCGKRFNSSNYLVSFNNKLSKN